MSEQTPVRDPSSQIFEQIEVERLVLREPSKGKVRAILETVVPEGPPEEPQVPCVRLSLLSPWGDVALMAEVDGGGTPSLHVGNPDRGVTTTITPSDVNLWAEGNVVATLGSTRNGGELELLDEEGRTIKVLPRSFRAPDKRYDLIPEEAVANRDDFRERLDRVLGPIVDPNDAFLRDDAARIAVLDPTGRIGPALWKILGEMEDEDPSEGD